MQPQSADASKPEVGTPAAQDIVLPADSTRVRLRIELPPETRLEVEVEARAQNGRLLGQERLAFSSVTRARYPWRPFDRPLVMASSLAHKIATAPVTAQAGWLAWASMAIYLLVRLVGLPAFPIYFFTDEAVQTVLAADFLRDNFHSPTGELLPTFFQNGTQYNLGVSVYLQIVPYILFGKSIWVTRGTAVLVTALAAISVGLVLRKIFKTSYGWMGMLFLSITPAWFLHSRTAFETGLSTTFFAVFLYFYLMYRDGHPRYLYAAVIAGALAFYSYSSARVVMLAAGMLLLISDARYHWQQRGLVVRAFGLTLLLALPFARFLYNHPEASNWQMRLLGSIWVTDVPLVEKLDVTLGEYLGGLNPLYWYLPSNQDISRHIMLGYGHLLLPTLPLGLFGVGLALRNFRNSSYRALLIAILAAPAGSSLVRLGITRVLFMVIPMTILTALGTAVVLGWVARRTHFSQKMLASGVFILLAGGNLYMLNDALVKGPLWFQGYGLAGMQYGARQVFGEIARYLKEKPETKIVLSPSWANGTDVVARFFFPDPLPFELGTAEGYYSTGRPIDKNQLFIMIPEEYASLPLERFSKVEVEKYIPYPNLQPGFYFVRLRYVDNIEAILTKEYADRHTLNNAVIRIGDQLVKVGYTKLDMGKVDFLFDGNLGTLVRTWSVNPMRLTFDFPSPRVIKSLSVGIGGTATQVDVHIWQEGVKEPVQISQKLEEVSMPRILELNLPDDRKIVHLEIEISNINDPPDGHVHVWEVTFK
jgi:4-amino-4-deoxy-L-arabinose transferase-like glycosyltransferase